MESSAVYRREANSIAEQIWRKYKPEKIVLFGSCARGTASSESDIDLLIVKDTRKRRVDRVREVLSLVDYNVPFDPIVYTKKELEARRKLGDQFIERILEEGEVLYGPKT